MIIEGMKEIKIERNLEEKFFKQRKSWFRKDLYFANNKTIVIVSYDSWIIRMLTPITILVEIITDSISSFDLKRSMKNMINPLKYGFYYTEIIQRNEYSEYEFKELERRGYIES